MAQGRKTGGRKPGTKNKIQSGVQEWALGVVEDPVYRAKLLERLHNGTLHTTLETMVWHYAYGRPVERHEVTGADGGPLVVEATRYAED